MNEFMTNAILSLKEHAPKILTGLGIASGAACAVGAAVQTYNHFDEVIELHNKEVAKVKEDPNASSGKALSLVYLKTFGRFIRVYAYPLALGGLSAVCVIGSEHMMEGRNNALTAALATTMGGFAAYRKAVVDRYGNAVDKELRLGLTPTEVEETDENGKTTKKTIYMATRTKEQIEKSSYARLFTEGNAFFTDDALANKCFIDNQLKLLNALLMRNGVVFLNEVYESLGFPRTIEGQYLGWIRPRYAANQIGDNYISVGLENLEDPNVAAFLRGHESSVWLDFNCTDILNGYFRKKLKGDYGDLSVACESR